MILRTTKQQDDAIVEWYRPIVRAHHAEDCPPPGFTLQVELGHPSGLGIGYEAVVVCGSARLAIGEVEASWPDEPSGA